MGKSGRFAGIAILTLLAGLLAAVTHGQEAGKPVGLAYDARSRGPVPIPPAERELQTVTAEPWFQISAEGRILEGPAFDRAGNLLLCDVTGRRVLRLSPERTLSTVTTLDRFAPGGIAVHKDGRLFLAALDLASGSGCIAAVQPDGSGLRTIIPPEAGHAPNDLVFDASGGLYFTDFRGHATDPRGGVYHASADGTAITPVLPRLALANGVALAPGGRALWVTEFGRNLLHRLSLADATTLDPIGSGVAYHFTGPAPDSMRADRDGNLYVAIYGQGRVLAFNSNGIPIGQILLPGRDDGHFLRCTSLAIRPGSDELFIVSSDGDGGKGAEVFHAKGFSQALPLYSHQ